MKIWKYPIGIMDEQEITVPEGAKVLCVQMQDGTPTLWYQISDNHALRRRKILVVGTGHERTLTGTKYVGTVQMSGGALVWHVFEEEMW